MAVTVQRLGVMGGSFDPVHIAHLIVADMVREALHLDLVLFVPVASQPLKPDKPVASASHRLAMLYLAVEGNPYFSVSRVDVDRPGPSYTVDTMQHLRRQWGGPDDVQMWFILGSDSLSTFPQWRDPERILALTRLAVVRRPGTEPDMNLLQSRLPALANAADFVDAPLIQISSRDLRRRVAEGRSIRYRVPEPVRHYIEAHNLYRRHTQRTG